MDSRHLEVLAQLPVLLNSSLDIRQIVSSALNPLRSALEVEASTIFIRQENSDELMIWALRGGGERLSGTRMPLGKGIVGWSIVNNQSVRVDDAQKDPRFFPVIEKEGSFITRNLLCVPLSARGSAPFGAIQALNKTPGFGEHDLQFLERYAAQLALAIDNARLFQTAQTRNQMLETMDRRKEEMISLIVHEFQTPLNLILTSGDMIASGSISDPKTVKQLTETLIHGVMRISKTIANIKNVSTLAKKSLPIKKEPFAIGPIVERLHSHFGAILKKRELSFHGKIDPQFSSAQGDEGLITIVLSNLISNAIRFTPNGGSITVWTEGGGGMVRVCVTDTGIGIAESQIPLIFEKFYEVTSVLEHSSGEFEFRSCGLGLGLAAVRSVLAGHGATVEVQSKLGAGSTFSFRLPIAEGQQ